MYVTIITSATSPMNSSWSAPRTVAVVFNSWNWFWQTALSLWYHSFIVPVILQQNSPITLYGFFPFMSLVFNKAPNLMSLLLHWLGRISSRVNQGPPDDLVLFCWGEETTSTSEESYIASVRDLILLRF